MGMRVTTVSMELVRTILRDGTSACDVIEGRLPDDACPVAVKPIWGPGEYGALTAIAVTWRSIEWEGHDELEVTFRERQDGRDTAWRAQREG